MRQVSWVPGATAANTNIDIPAGSPKIESLLACHVKRAEVITWSGLGAAGATIATTDVVAAGSGSDAVSEAETKTVVTATPGGGQVQKVDEDTIQLGDAILAGDEVVIQYLPVGELVKVA